MTTRSFASTIANGSWIGLAVLLPIGALLVAVVLVEVGQALFGLADLACAPCVSPSDGIDTAAAGVGGLGGGLAGGGAASGGGSGGGTGETGGVGVGRGDRTIIPPPGGGNLAGDASRQEWTRGMFGPGMGPIEQTIFDTTIRVQEQVEKWTQEWIDPDRRTWLEEKGTAPASKA